MTISRLNGVLHQLRDGLATTGPSDGQLLERFLARRDEAAFESLVRRHGPMVLGVCRRVLRHSHDAEDAFQATFLVLVRKAASVRPRELVGHWLYGVAYRTALKAKALAAKRSVKERKMPPQETHHDEPPADWLPLLDEELQRLPDKYRLPLVLCDLDGKTRKEAARQLGWPDGTLSTRLTRARLLLAERLMRRGVALAGGAAVLAALSGAASAQVPMTLTASTVKAAMGFAAGSTATAVSSNVAVLTQGVLKTMLLSKLKTVLVIGVLLALVGLGVGAGVFRNAVDAQVPPPVPTKPRMMPMELPPPPGSDKLTSRPMPTPGVVSLTRTGTIAVTRRSLFYQPPTAVGDKGQPVTPYPLVDVVTTAQYSREDVQVYDSAGKRVAAPEVSRLLKEGVTALVYSDGEKPDPLHLKLFKDGVLFVVLPMPKAPVAPPAPAVETGVPPVPVPHSADDPTLPNPPTDPTKPHRLSDEQLKLFKELQGEWLLVSQTTSGQKIVEMSSTPKLTYVVPGEQTTSGQKVVELPKDFRVEISHGNVIRMGVGTKLEPATAARKTFIVRPGSPNQFDLTTFDADGDAKQWIGIYKLKEDELTICLAPPGAERPRRFETPDGSKHMVLELRRVPTATTPR